MAIENETSDNHPYTSIVSCLTLAAETVVEIDLSSNAIKQDSIDCDFFPFQISLVLRQIKLYSVLDSCGGSTWMIDTRSMVV